MKISIAVASLAAGLLISSARAHAETADSERQSEMPTEILVDLQDNATDADELEVESRLGLHLHPNSAYSRTHEKLYIGEVDPSQLLDLMEKLSSDPHVEHVEPNFVFKASMVPNDPMFGKQWSFVMVDAPAAWDSADGSGVTVAVIDTGVAFENHQKFRQVEDLKDTTFVQGYDFVDDDDHANDDHGHGTHVAGTIAQSTNNGVGVAGLAPKARIMPLKVLNKYGMGTAADIADAIRYAADEGANVINMSLGGGGRSIVMESAVAYARKKGLVVVCAAGNGGQGRVEYPAAYKGAFAVSAVGPDKELAYYSSWGKELAISAPGGDKQKGGDEGAILQNTITPQRIDSTDLYLAFQGTSMATPHVAGAAALVMSAGVTDASKVEEILKSTAQPVGSQGERSAQRAEGERSSAGEFTSPITEKGWSEKYGAGILNVGAAVKAAHDDAGGKWHFAAGLSTLLLFALRVRKKIPFSRLGLGAIVGTIVGASGLWFLNGLGLHLEHIPILSLLAEPMPLWDEAVVGASWHMTALWASVLPMLGVSILLLSVKRLRGLLVGLSIGWGAYLLVSAVLMPSDVLFIPGTAGVLDRIWLVLNGALCLVLARLMANLQKTTVR
jgi:serine protease